ncbi:hypothetical protein TSAR_005116 [Trichomalopsis sarcophagae]|uniref:Uncharacterized protein n=1 Tax=Trichomalopsis sarcophagae TaxID=543379 RepID=A0A232EDX2_9HYME|nr:hypothetical protein TSAR_005116 [Trichomalopsis sarcophagae]
MLKRQDTPGELPEEGRKKKIIMLEAAHNFPLFCFTPPTLFIQLFNFLTIKIRFTTSYGVKSTLFNKILKEPTNKRKHFLTSVTVLQKLTFYGLKAAICVDKRYQRLDRIA